MNSTSPQFDAAPAAGGAVFFDLDKTLMQGSSAFQFARAVRQAGLMTRRQLASDAVANVRFRLRGASDAESAALRDRIAASLEGIRVRELERLGTRVLVGILPRLYPQMLEIAYGHQDSGRSAYIVTAAAQELAEVLARVMAFDGAIGSTLSSVEDGVYTGQPTGAFIYGQAKATAIAELAEEKGYDLSASYAYSDSASDVPMLEVVGHAVVVNPDSELERLARERGWDVLRLDRLGRRLIVAGIGVLAVAVAGGVTAGVYAARARERARGPAARARERARRPAPRRSSRGSRSGYRR